MFMLFGMKPRSIESVLEERIYEAQREYLDHAAAAARFQALATLYKKRVAWLQAERDAAAQGKAPVGPPRGAEGLPEASLVPLRAAR